MYIHIGERKTVSSKECVGIFNADTLVLSDSNEWILEECDENSKTIVITADGDVLFSKVSPYTVLKRNFFESNYYWRRT